MAVVYSTTVKNNRLTQVLNAIDGGAGNGLLKIGTTGMGTVLVQVTLAKPSFSISGGVMTLLGVTLSATASNTGTAAEATLTDSTGTVVASGLTVGTSGTNVIVSTTSITSGQSVQVTSGTITHG